MLVEYVRNVRTVGALRERRHYKMDELETAVVSVLMERVLAEVLTREDDEAVYPEEVLGQCR